MSKIPAENIIRVGGQVETFDKTGKLVLDYLVKELNNNDYNFDDCSNALDLGCGCGRVSLHFIEEFPNIRLFACDVDHSSINILPKDRFNLVPIVNLARPPLPYLNNYFDLIFSVSVWTHLNETLQYEWLDELNRILSPDGVALVTIASYHTLAIHRKRKLQHALKTSDVELGEKGFVFFPQNQTADRSWPGTEDYGLTMHSQKYIEAYWSKHIKVVKVVPGGIAGGQDIVILKKLEE